MVKNSRCGCGCGHSQAHGHQHDGGQEHEQAGAHGCCSQASGADAPDRPGEEHRRGSQLSDAPSDPTVADQVYGVIEAFVGKDPSVQVTCWDGSGAGDPAALIALTVNSPRALRRLLWDPNELGLGRAYVSGDLDLRGSIFDLLALRDNLQHGNEDVALRMTLAERVHLVGVARRLGAIGLRPPPPPEEARLRGRRHSKKRDAAAISHHYDVGNDFYRLALGPTMTYSCAYFPSPATSLDEAQELKHELICRKLALSPGMRLLDVGCGWGGMVMHAARHHGVEAVGITISAEQAALARRRVEGAGLGDRVEIRLQDYRDIADGPYDAISSIGMFEHVGIEQLTTYLQILRDLLTPEGRLLNHAISRTEGTGRIDPDSFAGRYVFPDGELQEVGRVISALQDEDMECRDVESLREHYARTLRRWVANLEQNWDDAVALVGEGRARVWLLYMAGSALGFEAHRINVHQVLATRNRPDGTNTLAPTRSAFLTSAEDLRAGAASPGDDRGTVRLGANPSPSIDTDPVTASAQAIG